jgi:hypothetical protein
MVSQLGTYGQSSTCHWALMISLTLTTLTLGFRGTNLGQSYFLPLGPYGQSYYLPLVTSQVSLTICSSQLGRDGL